MSSKKNESHKILDNIKKKQNNYMNKKPGKWKKNKCPF